MKRCSKPLEGIFFYTFKCGSHQIILEMYDGCTNNWRLFLHQFWQIYAQMFNPLVFNKCWLIYAFSCLLCFLEIVAFTNFMLLLVLLAHLYVINAEACFLLCVTCMCPNNKNLCGVSTVYVIYVWGALKMFWVIHINKTITAADIPASTE